MKYINNVFALSAVSCLLLVGCGGGTDSTDTDTDNEAGQVGTTTDNDTSSNDVDPDTGNNDVDPDTGNNDVDPDTGNNDVDPTIGVDATSVSFTDLSVSLSVTSDTGELISYDGKGLVVTITADLDAGNLMKIDERSFIPSANFCGSITMDTSNVAFEEFNFETFAYESVIIENFPLTTYDPNSIGIEGDRSFEYSTDGEIQNSNNFEPNVYTANISESSFCLSSSSSFSVEIKLLSVVRFFEDGRQLSTSFN